MDRTKDHAEGDRLIAKLGWAALSRSKLKEAEKQLINHIEGVRDEVGILGLHRDYANRFFPGTSTQQTRLRYALFVPWQILSLLRGKVEAIQARKELKQREIRLALQLEGQDGIIGAQNADKGLPVTIPPSAAYWVALREWGILNALSDSVDLTHRTLFRHWDEWGERIRERSATDDEGRALDKIQNLFNADLPNAPPRFDKRKLTFELKENEKEFLKSQLANTTRLFDGQRSLLALLALEDSAEVPTQRDSLWSERVLARADKWDKKAIKRARDIASLSVVFRSIYLGAVESLKELDGAPSASESHRKHLVAMTETHGQRALNLQLETLEEDEMFLDEGLFSVLRSVQEWIKHDGKNALEKSMYQVLVDWEVCRKGKSRSKLPKSKLGREARRTWNSNKIKVAEPIDYRWPNVKQLLLDLRS